jgi:hypothetical protein
MCDKMSLSYSIFELSFGEAPQKLLVKFGPPSQVSSFSYSFRDGW